MGITSNAEVGKIRLVAVKLEVQADRDAVDTV
jgi:hypothetical protein